MNSEPCVRFGMRISPKISEKPADSKNSSPPNVTLLTDSTSQKFIGEHPRWLGGRLGHRSSPCKRGPRAWQRTGFPLARERTEFASAPNDQALVLHRRVVARIDRLREELLLVVGPELADVVIGLDRLVDELAVRLLDPPDVEVADHVAEMVELD